MRSVLCEAEEGTLSHVMEKCAVTPRESIRVEEVVLGKINVKVEEWLRDLEKKKKGKPSGVKSRRT